MGTRKRNQRGSGCFGRSCARSTPTEHDLIAAFNEEDYKKCEKYLGAPYNMRINVLVYAEIKNKEMVEFLADHGFNWSTERVTNGAPGDGDTLPLRAARCEACGIYNNFIVDLIAVDAYFGVQGRYKSTPFIEAIRYNLDDALVILDELENDFASINTGVGSLKEYINIRDIDGRSAYDYSLDTGDDTLTQRLCDLGADQCTTIKEIKGAERTIPEGAKSAISWEPIAPEDNMVNFQDEFKYGRYYTAGNWGGIKSKGVNPFTGTPIEEITKYTAKGGRTKSRSKSSKTRSKSR